MDTKTPVLVAERTGCGKTRVGVFAPMDGDTVITTEDEARLKLELRSKRIDAAVLSRSTLVAKHNTTLQVDALRRCGEKNRVLKMLQKMTQLKLRRAVALEIICIYIYYSDFEGALGRYQSTLIQSFELSKMKVFIEIHISRSECGDSIHLLNRSKLVALLSTGFDLNAFAVLLDHTNIGCRKRGCVGKKCFLEVIETLRFVEDAEYAGQLNFDECNALKKYFDGPAIERQRILCNPWMPEIDVFRYLQRCPDDLALLAHVAERRRLVFLAGDRRLRLIQNEAIHKRMSRTYGKRKCGVNPALFDDVRTISKGGDKYFRPV